MFIQLFTIFINRLVATTLVYNKAFILTCIKVLYDKA